MYIPILSDIVKGVAEVIKGKQKVKMAVIENKVRLAASQGEFNHEWEMKQLDNSGYKDDVLFYAVIGLFVWSGFCPERAAVVFANWELLPEWFLQITMWLVASVIGVKKVGEYLPGLIGSVKAALAKEK
jgi:hypothetical protein